MNRQYPTWSSLWKDLQSTSLPSVQCTSGGQADLKLSNFFPLEVFWHLQYPPPTSFAWGSSQCSTWRMKGQHGGALVNYQSLAVFDLNHSHGWVRSYVSKSGQHLEIFFFKTTFWVIVALSADSSFGRMDHGMTWNGVHRPATECHFLNCSRKSFIWMLERH